MSDLNTEGSGAAGGPEPQIQDDLMEIDDKPEESAKGDEGVDTPDKVAEEPEVVEITTPPQSPLKPDDDKDKAEEEADENKPTDTVDAEAIDIFKPKPVSEPPSTSEGGEGEKSQDADATESSNQDKEKPPSEEDEEDEGAFPMISVSKNIFDVEEDDECEEMDPDLIANMMQVEMNEGGANEPQNRAPPPPPPRPLTVSAPSRSTPTPPSTSSSSTEPERRPRRAAAAIAANTIRKISDLEHNKVPEKDDDDEYEEEDDDEVQVTSRRSGSGSDRFREGNEPRYTPRNPNEERHNCYVCKKFQICSIVVRRHGSDLHMCSNACFNSFKNPQRPLVAKKAVTCPQCTASHNLNYFWETMNFCSDNCVATYQITIGSKCSTCSSKVSWLSMGKYCVRFGSDVRQFCTSSCLEAYKKNARVCFHCQLDIKLLRNVVLATIPQKNAPKEFCSQTCVEMYVETNLNTQVAKNTNYVCAVCSLQKSLYRELIVANVSSKICSEQCWKRLFEMRKLSNFVKCEICPKFLAIELHATDYLVNPQKTYNFCSPVCKNVFVLRKREIMSCTACKVKKYNYDLIHNPIRSFYACSLNCLPRPSTYILKLKDSINEGSPMPSKPAQYGGATPRTPRTRFINTNAPPQSIQRTYEAPQEPQDPFPTIQIASVSSLASQTTQARRRSSGTSTGSGPSRVMEHDSNSNSMEALTLTEEERGAYDFDIDDELASTECVLVVAPPTPVEMRNKKCMTKPKARSRGVQVDLETSDTGEIVNRGERAPEKVYLPLPIFVPIPVFIPFPVYALSEPVPYPMPIPIPVPIPLFDLTKSNLDLTPQEASQEVDKDGGDGSSTSSRPTTPSTPISKALEAQPVAALKVREGLGGSGSSGTPGSGKKASKMQAYSPSKLKMSRIEYAIKAWKMFFKAEALTQTTEELVKNLVTWTLKGKKPSGERYKIDLLYFLCLGLQEHFIKANRDLSFFYDENFSPFVTAFTEYAEDSITQGFCKVQILDDNLWESSEFGSGSPGVLLFTLVYILHKNFKFSSDLEFKKLQFDQVEILEEGNKKYVTISGLLSDSGEIAEKVKVFANDESLVRCPVRLFQAYFDKIMTKKGPFLRGINKGWKSNPGAAWYKNEPLGESDVHQLHIRAMMIKGEHE